MNKNHNLNLVYVRYELAIELLRLVNWLITHINVVNNYCRQYASKVVVKVSA